jgi:sec-independent protein translocase protein TatB
MDFFGIGPLELLVIAVLALIVLGPKRLPEFAVQVARLVRDFRKYTASLSGEVSGVIKEFEREQAALDAEWKEVGEGLGDARAQLQSAVGDAERGARSIEAEIRGDGAVAGTATPPAASGDGGAPPA